VINIGFLTQRYLLQEFTSQAIDQVYDYALDLKYFHEPSHDQLVVPVLIATEAKITPSFDALLEKGDKLLAPLESNAESLAGIIDKVLSNTHGIIIDSLQWKEGRYCPTPTIVEAALALYNGHSVKDISRSDASAINLSQTSDAITKIIQLSKEKHQKSICFVTGVPGAGKTLVGRNYSPHNQTCGLNF
jgi:cystathionine beta-lyase family protein involved in aluminum resistance